MTLFYVLRVRTLHSFFFFFNDTATTEIYTLSLHDALPIYNKHATVPVVIQVLHAGAQQPVTVTINVREHPPAGQGPMGIQARDRKSTRLNSSHGYISYAVFCLKKKKNRATH